MKLLYCPNCEDIIKLRTKVRFCDCGAISGRYLDNKMAVYTGDAVPLGIDNNMFLGAVIVWQATDGTCNFDAFIISKDCSTFVKVVNQIG